MSTEDIRALHRRYAEEVSRGNLAYLDEYIDQEYTYHGPTGELDKEGFMATHDMFLAAFPDSQMTLDDTIAEGDKVVSRWTIRATHKGEFQGIAPTGREVTFRGIIISRIRAGKAVEEWEAFDLLSVMQQLGAIPTSQQG